MDVAERLEWWLDDMFYCSDRWSLDRLMRCHWEWRHYMKGVSDGI